MRHALEDEYFASIIRDENDKLYDRIGKVRNSKNLSATDAPKSSVYCASKFPKTDQHYRDAWSPVVPSFGNNIEVIGLIMIHSTLELSLLQILGCTLSAIRTVVKRLWT